MATNTSSLRPARSTSAATSTRRSPSPHRGLTQGLVTDVGVWTETHTSVDVGRESVDQTAAYGWCFPHSGTGPSLAVVEPLVSTWLSGLDGIPTQAQNVNQQHYAASLMKVPVAIAAYRLRDRGLLSLDEPITV